MSHEYDLDVRSIYCVKYNAGNAAAVIKVLRKVAGEKAAEVSKMMRAR